MAEPISLRIPERVRMDLRLSLLICSTWSQPERFIRPLEIIPLEAAKLWEISHGWWVREYYPDWVRTLLSSGGRGPLGEKKEHAPRGTAAGNTLSEFRLISITSIQKARIWERKEIIRGRVGENNPFGLKTCDICRGSFRAGRKTAPSQRDLSVTIVRMMP